MRASSLPSQAWHVLCPPGGATSSLRTLIPRARTDSSNRAAYISHLRGHSTPARARAVSLAQETHRGQERQSAWKQAPRSAARARAAAAGVGNAADGAAALVTVKVAGAKDHNHLCASRRLVRTPQRSEPPAALIENPCSSHHHDFLIGYSARADHPRTARAHRLASSNPRARQSSARAGHVVTGGAAGSGRIPDAIRIHMHLASTRVLERQRVGIDAFHADVRLL